MSQSANSPLHSSIVLQIHTCCRDTHTHAAASASEAMAELGVPKQPYAIGDLT
eukprot:COSAG02_NODE_31949_length_524_cov_1.858824_2_plen_52_part_01